MKHLLFVILVAIPLFGCQDTKQMVSPVLDTVTEPEAETQTETEAETVNSETPDLEITTVTIDNIPDADDSGMINSFEATYIQEFDDAVAEPFWLTVKLLHPVPADSLNVGDSVSIAVSEKSDEQEISDDQSIWAAYVWTAVIVE